MHIKKAASKDIFSCEVRRRAILYVSKMLIIENRKGKIIVAVSFVPKSAKAIVVKPVWPMRKRKTGYPK